MDRGRGHAGCAAALCGLPPRRHLRLRRVGHRRSGRGAVGGGGLGGPARSFVAAEYVPAQLGVAAGASRAGGHGECVFVISLNTFPAFFLVELQLAQANIWSVFRWNYILNLSSSGEHVLLCRRDARVPDGRAPGERQGSGPERASEQRDIEKSVKRRINI